jgi:hypothetical protein
MEIIILGVGRSGTTALYNVLQTALSDQNRTVKYVYEPFLWDQKTFDKPFTSISSEFTYVSSLSIDGIYHNKRLPLFMDDESVESIYPHEYLASLHAVADQGTALLAKYIRANGRYRLIRKMRPEARIIIMLRNPLDVINSSINMFSFFGDDYHASDADRFLDEADRIYPGVIDQRMFKDNVVYREGIYWFLMTRKLLHDVEGDANVFCLPYEEFTGARVRWFKKICEFAGLEYRDDYGEALTRKVGPIRSVTVNLSKDDYQVLLPLLDEYSTFVDKTGYDFDRDRIQKKYRGRLLETREFNPLRGRLPAYLLEVISREEIVVEQDMDIFRRILRKLSRNSGN